MRENVFVCDLCHARVEETKWYLQAVGLYLKVYLPCSNPMGEVSTNRNWQSYSDRIQRSLQRMPRSSCSPDRRLP